MNDPVNLPPNDSLSHAAGFSDPRQVPDALAAKAFEACGEGVIICDPEKNILAVNACFCESSGYSASEAIGKNPSLLKSGIHDEAFYQTMWASIAATGSWSGTITNRHRSGNLYSQWLSISTVVNAAGAITHYIGLFSAVRGEQQLNERMRHLTQYDALTDLPNRTLFLDRFAQVLMTAQRYQRSVALLWIDLSRFYVINDTYGYRVGDAVLQETARRLTGLIRKGDTAARLSGDEFCLLMANLGNEKDAILLAERTIETVTAPMVIQDKEITLALNVGLSLFPKDGTTPEALLKTADIALQRAKDTEGNCFRFFTHGMDSDVERRLHLESDLRNAIAKEQLVMHYQPQVDLASGRITGIEGLMRWNHPVMGPISPVEFIPIAEETGLIHSIGAWALTQVCQQSRRWQDGGLPPLPVAVNLSAKQFHQQNIVETIAVALKESGLPPALLELELTESAFTGNIRETASIIQRIKALGVQLVLDDFGTGYSSLAYLSGFPFDKIKIDHSFVHDITENPVNAAIATATIAMARSLNLIVLAEGVETEAQMQFLRMRQCEAMQGYLFSKALPADEVARMLTAGNCLPVSTREATEKTLLLVDDEPGILNALRRLLRRDGYRILTAESPLEGFALLAQNDVQVIISDQRMPEMNGTEFLARVKQLYPETIRIVLSGYTDLQTVTDAINRGAIYRFLTKPWDDEVLRAQVREAFRVARGLSHA